MASSVSKKVFGDDIDPDVKKILVARQAFAQTSNPLESIDTNDAYGLEVNPYDYSGNFGGTADLSSRTPFARMWAAVEVVHSDEEKGKVFATKKEAEAALESNDLYIKKIKDDEFRHFRATPMDKGREFYEIGNHLLNTVSVNPNESLEGIKQLTPQVFDTNKNEFMKPPAGITKVSSQTQSSLGALIETTIDFSVHNFHDFENIYQRFFLRHGAQVVVDFGWDTATIYDPSKLDFETPNLGVYLYNNYVVKSHGSLNTVVGLVTKYDAKLRDDGGFNCSITMTSRNIALIDHKIDKGQKRRIKKVLDVSILQYITRAFKETKDGDKPGENTKRLMDRAESPSFNPDTLDEWEEAYGSFANTALKFTKAKAIPSETSVKWGVYYTEEENEKSLYVSYGFFEDKILNLEFGFGDKLDPGFESLSFVTWNRNLFARQLHAQKMTGLDFLYPENWDNTYSTIRKKVPSRKNNFQDPKEKEPTAPYTKIDQDKGSIPLRELFISVDLIKKGVDNASTVIDFIKYVLDGVNSDSKDIFKLNFGPIDIENQGKMSIVDENHLGMSHEDADEDFKKMFVFHPHSKNSIVKSYDFSMSTPTGNMQNMIAIQSMSPGEQMFPISSFVAQAVAEKVLTAEQVPNVGIRYLPVKDRYKLNKLKKDIDDDEVTALNFVDDDDILGKKDRETNAYLDSFTALEGEDLKNLEDAVEKIDKIERGDEDEDEKVNEVNEEEGKDDEDVRVAGTISSYYEMLAKREFHSKKNPIILPISLGLAIYGISGMTPGNLFRVDYLSKAYFENVFFHIKKVTHDINNTTWTTSFETQMRMRPGAGSEMMDVDVSVVLNKNVIKDDPVKLTKADTLLKVIKNLKIKDITQDNYEKISFIFIFEAAKDKTIEIPQYSIGRNVGYAEVDEHPVTKKSIVPKTETKVNVDKQYYLITQKEAWVVIPFDGPEEPKDYDYDVWAGSYQAIYDRGAEGVKAIGKAAQDVGSATVSGAKTLLKKGWSFLTGD